MNPRVALQNSKRQYGELQQKYNAYEELFRILATKTQYEATEVLNRIRGGDSVEAILRHIRDADLLLQLHVVPDDHHQYSFPYHQDMPTVLIQEGNPYLDSWLYKYSSFGGQQPYRDRDLSNWDSAHYRIPYHAAEIVDPRLNATNAKKWTSIVDDDILLNRLLQMFFLTEYTWYPAFHKDYFLEDMVAGRKRYCSSLLVNAILASACVRFFFFFFMYVDSVVLRFYLACLHEGVETR